MGISMMAVAIIGAAVVAIFLALSAYARSSDTWGATADEVAASLTGDEWLEGGPAVRARMTRVIAIEAPPEVVWPWIAQMGRGAGWYSYDRLDNGGRTSARHIVNWIPEPRLGDATPIGYLRHIDPGREVVWWLKSVRFLGSRFRAVMLYRVIGDGGRSRLLVRVQMEARGLVARPACWLVRILDGFMMRRQLAEIRQRAESHGDRRSDPERPETGARDQFQLYQAIYASGEEAGVRGKEGAAACRRQAIEDGVIEPAAESA